MYFIIKVVAFCNSEWKTSSKLWGDAGEQGRIIVIREAGSAVTIVCVPPRLKLGIIVFLHKEHEHADLFMQSGMH